MAVKTVAMWECCPRHTHLPNRLPNNTFSSLPFSFSVGFVSRTQRCSVYCCRMGNTRAIRTTWSSSRQTAGAAWQPSASQGPWRFPWVQDPPKRGHLWTVSVYYKLHIMLWTDTGLLISLKREIHDHIIYTLEIQVLSLVAQFCSTLCDPMECSPPGSSVRGILQASILEWVATSSSRGIFLTQGSKLCLLPWQAGSIPLSHLGSS